VSVVIVAAETGRTASAKPVASVVVAVAATVLMTVRRVTGLGPDDAGLGSGAGVGVGIGEFGWGRWEKDRRARYGRHKPGHNTPRF
jgi:hypothetical protein